MFQLLLAIIYLSFISLGLPDAMLGAAWPEMSQNFAVPVSYAGTISVVISMGTILSSFQSDRLNRRFGTGKVTMVSVATTAVALLGFSASTSYYQILLWAIPYGLGAGSVDAALNNYVACHYASRHMSWLHCMWGVGASVGPYVVGLALSNGMGWNTGYRIIGIFQIVLTAVLLLSLSLWKKEEKEAVQARKKALSLKEVFAIPGAREIILAFFCYIAAENTCILWGSSYFAMYLGLPEEVAASLGSLFLIGITAGRFVSGFLTYKINDRNMIRLGQCLMLCGCLMMLLPLGQFASMAGLIVIGLGCAPVYPCIIHSTPENFGAENSQAIIGVQMAGAYIGGLVMPPIFGILARYISAGLLPIYAGVITLLMVLVCERLNRMKRVK